MSPLVRYASLAQPRVFLTPLPARGCCSPPLRPTHVGDEHTLNHTSSIYATLVSKHCRLAATHIFRTQAAFLPNRVNSGRRRYRLPWNSANFRRVRPGSTNCGLGSAELGPSSASFGRLQPDLATRDWHSWGHPDQTWPMSTNFGTAWNNFGPIWATDLAKPRQILAELGPLSVDVLSGRAELGQIDSRSPNSSATMAERAAGARPNPSRDPFPG